MHYRLITALLLIGAAWLTAAPAQATRIKDLATIEGVRENQLMGYGLVIGLSGTGDDITKSVFTKQAIINMTKRMGVALTADVYKQMKTKNIAAVMVTAQLPPFARPGSAIDIQVSSLGDASSLSGGTLLMTPLKGPDNSTYAVAQGPLAVGGISFGGKAAKAQKNFATSGRVSGGAIVERAVDYALPPTGDVIYQLRETDFTTAARMVEAINRRFGVGTAQPVDSGTVKVARPKQFPGDMVTFIADLEGIEVAPDGPAKIVVNERTGTIVMGQDVRIATVAVSHGNLNLVITESTQVSQPNPLAQGTTTQTPATTIKAVEDTGNLVVLPMGVNLGDIARALNAIGATPRDLIAIFQAIKAAGALQGELVIL
ncbi:MAG: flagellar basal body P-ring protein FlgI [Desulfobulbus sp.]|jgi:flagellar P-ring protein precursor FlgI|uniref:flagellar basal body P-ring protein FlgI n=1 Tax=Desulfobulbus sp. TaxID=895 RepID=UPI00283C8983|nr:flagellar basal body P-ring protein FlgI [Desulfobulbus sp.]MDR2550746.1 flagellar basal body P-ring protein FlgI [Desulfobulbus sp.]